MRVSLRVGGRLSVRRLEPLNEDLRGCINSISVFCCFSSLAYWRMKVVLFNITAHLHFITTLLARIDSCGTNETATSGPKRSRGLNFFQFKRKVTTTKQPSSTMASPQDYTSMPWLPRATTTSPSSEDSILASNPTPEHPA